MIFKIAWMYYDLLELYSDRGNLIVMEKILQDNEIEYKLDKLTISDTQDISDYDFVFLGGGTDRAIKIVEEHLFSKKPEFKNVMKNNGFILTICGGYQLFGKYYKSLDNKITKGLGIFDYHTESGKNRCVGNIKIEVEDSKIGRVIGFENHAGETKNVDGNYFGKTRVGHGNEFGGAYEGYMSENFIGTYIHGPLLPKNPQIAKYIIESVLLKKYKIKKDIKVNLDGIAAKEQVKFK